MAVHSLAFRVALIAPLTVGALSGCGGKLGNEEVGSAGTGGATASGGSVASTGGSAGTGGATASGGGATSGVDGSGGGAAGTGTGGSSASGGLGGALVTGRTTRIGGVITFKCGDGVVNPGEVCDQGQYQGSSGCSADCKTQDPDYVCYPGEQCFPCNSNCTVGPHCGDGVISSLEQCDFGAELNLGEYGGCASNCMLGPHCGDGIANGPEQCDFGTGLNLGEYGGCISTCKLGPHCGDGVINGPEECDDGTGPKGNGSATSYCTTTCKRYLIF